MAPPVVIRTNCRVVTTAVIAITKFTIFVVSGKPVLAMTSATTMCFRSCLALCSRGSVLNKETA
eukprot:10617402-Alexandrium_andersonii.AAC.1